MVTVDVLCAVMVCWTWERIVVAVLRVISSGLEAKIRDGRVPYLACSEAKPSCACTEDGMPGKRVESSGARKKLVSVRMAKLTRGVG